MPQSPEVSGQTLALKTDDTTPAIPFPARGGTIFIPSGSSITTLTYYAAEKLGGTFLPLYESDGSTAVTQTVEAGKAYDMPAAIFGCLVIKIRVNSNGSAFVTMKG